MTAKCLELWKDFWLVIRWIVLNPDITEMVDRTKKTQLFILSFQFPADALSMDFEEAEFVWEDYLQETGATPVAPTAFKHVSTRLL